MQMSATDLAYMKGENSVKAGDTEYSVFERAEQNGYSDPDDRLMAFVTGFLNAIKDRG